MAAEWRLIREEPIEKSVRDSGMEREWKPFSVAAWQSQNSQLRHQLRQKERRGQWGRINDQMDTGA